MAATTTTNGLANGQHPGETPAGATSIPPRLPSAGTKRKRSASVDNSASTQTQTQVFDDLLELLTKHDPSPSVLQHNLPNASRLTKRSRLDNNHPSDTDTDTDTDTNTNADADTIASRLRHNLYSSLDELDHDLQDACHALLEPIKAKERLKNGQRLPADDIKAMQHVSDFHHLAKGFLHRERQKDSIKKEAVPAQDGSNVAQSKTVLSLYGNAPNPRQLFSSLQHPNAVTDGQEISLEELGLPNMLSATKVVPLQSADALGSRKPNPTFADLFAPPSTLPQLNPPKPSRHSSSKSFTISWSTGDLPKPSRKAGYTMQPLTVGTWVAYGGADSKESVSAIKRRRRESLLSNTEHPKPVEELSAADILAQESALFRQAYSSFAPTQDNAKALVPQETKHKVWWHRLGQKRFDKHFVLDPALDDSAFPPELERTAREAAEEEAAAIGGAEDLKEIEKVIQEYDEEAFKHATPDLVSTINEEDRNVEQMLVEISQLLKSLLSHQRIRNSYIASGSKNPASPSPLLSAMLGTSTVPSAEETETYKALRSQLAQMISKLPPYAVAKIDGEQLEELAVSKNIIIQGKEYRGSMEEDHLTRLIRHTEASAQAAVASLNRTNAGATAATPASSAQYGRAPSVSSRPGHATSNYYGSRTPATNYTRSGAAQSYNAPATAPRQSYSNAYASQPARPSSFGQTNQQYYQRPAYGATQYGVQTPQPANAPRAGYNVPQTAYASRTNSSPFVSNGLPNSSYNPQASYTQPRQPSAPQANAAATPNPQQYAPRPQSQAQPYTPAQPSSGRATPTFAGAPASNTPSAVGPSGFHSTLTSEQQQSMMERQRAQLAMQPQARMGAPPAQMQPQQPNGQA